MGKSLADQLLGAGLVDKKTARKAKNEKRKQDNYNRKHKIDVVDENKEAAEKARLEKAQRDRELNLAREAEKKEKELVVQAKQIIEHAKIKWPDEREIKYNFVDQNDNKIKAIYVDGKMQDMLAVGTLAIAVLGEDFVVIPKMVAEKIAERHSASIAFLAKKEDNQVDEDDPYADYVIPDDLMW